jgi:hypothetical protein
MISFKEYLRFVADKAVESPLLEMAIKRKEVVDHAKNLRNQISKHIIKIVLYPNDDSQRGWLNEVQAWLMSIHEARFDRSKLLKASQYYEILWVGPFENTRLLDDCISHPFIKLGMGAKPTNVPPNVDSIIQNIYLDISNHLASPKVKDFRECFQQPAYVQR